MQRAQAIYHLVEQPGIAFEQHAGFLRLTPFTVPLEHGFHVTQNIGATNQFFIEQRGSNGSCHVFAWKGTPYHRRHE